MAVTECFKIQILRNVNSDNWDISDMEQIYQILNDNARNSLLPMIIVADPFLFVHNERLYLFYEAKRYGQNGVIKMQHTSDLKHWSKPVTVLKESFHLSFPYVFKAGDDIYMIPETCAAKEVRLYKADDKTLTHFSFQNTLVEHDVVRDDIEIDYSDSFIYERDSVFYLFTTIKGKEGNELYIYTSTHIEGPYIIHPSSPVCKSMKFGRNGGGIIEKKEKLYRIAQDCVKRYGDNVHVLEIDNLSKESYSEHVIIENIIPVPDSFYSEGGHQYCEVRFNGDVIVATDAKEYHEFPIARKVYKLSRIPHKLIGR